MKIMAWSVSLSLLVLQLTDSTGKPWTDCLLHLVGHVAKYVKLNKVNTGGQMKKICILIVAKPSRP